MSKPRICEIDGHNILPLFRNAEQQWPPALRFVLYLVGLGWCFLGVAIASDVFMGAIEKITSKKVRTWNPKTNRNVTVHMWNPTVANLTLMALGSSAPEILLSIIELFSNDFFAGDLGPSTIVGSAAFNLFCIIAVCVVSIPEGEVRFIKELSVYGITASFSIFAYLWIVIILLGFSPNVVEPWEGIVTLLFFPVLVTLAYLADRGYFTIGHESKVGHTVPPADMTEEELANLQVEIQARHPGVQLTSEQLLQIINIEHGQNHTRAQYRVAATRKMLGGKPIGIQKTMSTGTDKLSKQLSNGVSPSNLKKVLPFDEEVQQQKQQNVIISFQSGSYGVPENVGQVTLTVRRSGNMEGKAFVKYRTRDGAAQAGSDYVKIEGGSITFDPNVETQTFKIMIMDDNAYENEEEFYVDLYDPVSETKGVTAEFGDIPVATIVIIDDDMPGVISFEKDVKTVTETSCDNEVKIKVHRKNGSTGVVSCKCRSEDDSAKAGRDYCAVNDTIVFKSGETEALVSVKINARGRYQLMERFRLILEDPTGGVIFDPDTDGGKNQCICYVNITDGQANKDRIDRLAISLRSNWEKAKVGHTNWRDQFKAAFYVNGGDDDDVDSDPPGGPQYFMHFVTLPWKLLLALVPPVDYCGGWLCFVCSLGIIGLITALIGDLAALVGCVTDVIPDAVTAITLVALGTSLPDTFASKTAAMQDPYADASIGNVTGSNSVNVFLGLGLPWTIGSLYWTIGESNDQWTEMYSSKIGNTIPARFEKGAFVVIAGSLVGNIIVFAFCAIVCLSILYARRNLYKGELGGPLIPKYITGGILVSLWLIYVGVSSALAIMDS